MIYVNVFCWIVAILSLVYAGFHFYLFGEVALWYWNVIKDSSNTISCVCRISLLFIR